MKENVIRILVVDDKSDDVVWLRTALVGIHSIHLQIDDVSSLTAALQRIVQEQIDLILLDLGLPDSQGLDTYFKIHAVAPAVPVIILTALEDELVATDAVREGAQDYLVKGQCDSQLLIRAIRYAIERHRMVAVLRGLTLIDDLTGLYNRRGFETLANQNLKLANRTRRKLLAISADLDGLARINDTYGHREGDQALRETGGVLKETFRETDILARVGSDEFAVIVLEAAEDAADILTNRLRRNLDRHNADQNRPYDLSLTVGVACYDPASPCSVDELVSRAGSLMLEEKQRKKRTA